MTTERDREAAEEFVRAAWWAGAVLASVGPAAGHLADALAAERERAVAPFLALAAQFERYAQSDDNDAEVASFGDRDYWQSSAGTWRSAAAEIRQIAEESR